MRMLVFFDLPVNTLENRRQYSRFRKFLISSGFVMMQESVYCKLIVNSGSADLMESKIRQAAPSEGIVQLLVVTEKQFSRIRCITGELHTDILSTPDRTVIL
ncbi:MAG: CRISPR-associated endonuclease Cas2 [Desulfovibrionaceae bacterium]|nr:CRISPR-associated endonuclease Cas2 [Desulfovibrionaceae bacterium]